MISLSENRTSLVNLGSTIDAIETLDRLIDYFNEPKPGPAYLTVRYAASSPEIQIDRAVFVLALEAQRDKLVAYLSTLGIDANS